MFFDTCLVEVCKAISSTMLSWPTSKICFKMEFEPPLTTEPLRGSSGNYVQDILNNLYYDIMLQSRCNVIDIAVVYVEIYASIRFY